MTRFEIIEAKPHHCGFMARHLRAEHQAAVMGIGADCHRQLRLRFDTSDWRRSWLVDGRVAGIAGVCGALLSPLGYIWLAFTQQALAHPVAIVKETRRQLADIMLTKRELVTLVLNEDTRSMRFAEFFGFEPVADDGSATLMGYPASPRPRRMM